MRPKLSHGIPGKAHQAAGVWICVELSKKKIEATTSHNMPDPKKNRTGNRIDRSAIERSS